MPAFENATPTVSYVDIIGQRATVSMDLGESLLGNWTDKSTALMVIVDAYTEALPVKRGDNFSHTYLMPKEADFPTPTAPYGTVDQKAVMTFLRESTIGYDAGYFTLSIPAPKASMFEQVKGKGWRVKASVGEAIAADLTDDLVSCSFVDGWLKSKK